MQNDERNQGGVRSDETLFSLIESLRELEGAGVTELANHLGLAKSTVYNHLLTMLDHGFVFKHGETYHLGLEFFSHGMSVRRQFGIYRSARPVIDELAPSVGEMVWLTTHENGRVMNLYGRADAVNVSADTITGTWTYLHCHAGGKAMLAHLSEEEISETIDKHGLPARTPQTITDRDELAKEMELIRERGYSLALGEDLEGINAVGIPLLFEQGVLSAISVAGPAHRVTRERCENELVEELYAAKNDIELNIEYN